MRWLGLDWDEGPIRQMDRLALYHEHAERLLLDGKAYRCYCSPEELDERRKQAVAKKLIPRYDGRCRERTQPVVGRPSAIRFKAPQAGQTIVDDMVKGRVQFDNAQLDDLIMVRSDGVPTYNFGVVVDDALMTISHVVRGDDHLNNTPRQIQIYHALGYTPPRFAHLSMILGPDKQRLSKRHGATSVTECRELGYLPDALVNYLARLGWSHGDQEIFRRQELIDHFDLDRITSAAAMFNPEKLLWLNSHYIHHSDGARLADGLQPFLTQPAVALAPEARPQLERVIAALKTRSRTLVEIAQGTICFFQEEIEIDPAAATKFLTPENAPALAMVREKLERTDDFSAAALETLFKQILETENLKMAQLAQPVRVALTGRTVSPGVFEVIELLGRERTLARLKKAVDLAAAAPAR